MPILKAPENCASISTSDGGVHAVVDGFVDTGDVSQKTLGELTAHGCRIATDDEIGAADLKTALEPTQQNAADEKAEIKATLHSRGVRFDGRATLAALRITLADSDAAIAAERKSAGEKKTGKSDKPKGQDSEAASAGTSGDGSIAGTIQG